MSKLAWSQESQNRWTARLAPDVLFVITLVPDGYKLNLESPIIDPSNDFHQVFSTKREAEERAEDMFDGLEKMFG